MNMFSPVTELNGIARKRAALYEKLDVLTVGDLVSHFPRGYTDYSEFVEIASAPLNEHAVVKALIAKKMPPARIRQGLTIYKVVVRDDSSLLTLVFYNNRFAPDALNEGEEYIFSGRITGNFTRREMNSPSFISAADTRLLRPVYALTEGLTSNMVINNVTQALKLLPAEAFTDPLPEKIRLEYGLSTYEYALQSIHFPQDKRAAELAKKRLAFDELLTLELGLMLLKRRSRVESAYKISPESCDIDEFQRALPFKLTNAQRKAIADIAGDLCGRFPMNRLVQGDVGSGKTAVAAAAAYFAYKNGLQTAFMAPTEILAKQHFATLSELMEPLGVKVCCLTGSASAKQRRELAEMISTGKADIITGTHALFSDSTEFKRLGLVIMDEQHRFGVNQRAKLADKGINPHKLVMSATPIPRTLALIIYGDLDISVLNELPAGRRKIETFAVSSKLRSRAFGFVKKQLDEGRQAYIVCPAIDEGVSELAAAKEYAKKLESGEYGDFTGYKTGILHGKMSAAEKDGVMSSFKAGEIALLVATTVVEVGVDVPNATVMMIENAERFGLSQLHQLRGRVGRGKHQSYCILVAGVINEETRERLKLMTETSDGFKISEYDLKLRGAGDFFGQRQHGLPEMKIADIAADAELLAQTSAAAKELIEESEDLGLYPQLKAATEKMFERAAANGMN